MHYLARGDVDLFRKLEQPTFLLKREVSETDDGDRQEYQTQWLPRAREYAKYGMCAMLRSAGARRLRKTLRRCPAGAIIAQRITSWAWDVTHERALSLADFLGGKAPVGALNGLLERIC